MRDLTYVVGWTQFDNGCTKVIAHAVLYSNTVMVSDWPFHYRGSLHFMVFVLADVCLSCYTLQCQQR